MHIVQRSMYISEIATLHEDFVNQSQFKYPLLDSHASLSSHPISLIAEGLGSNPDSKRIALFLPKVDRFTCHFIENIRPYSYKYSGAYFFCLSLHNCRVPRATDMLNETTISMILRFF